MNWPELANVPLTQSDRNHLIAQQPPAWEYLLFVSTVLQQLKEAESRYLDYKLGYSDRSGPTIEGMEVADQASRAMDEVLFLIGNMTRVFDVGNQVSAFGLPGSSGDAELVVHLGRRFADSYSALIDWGLDVFAWRAKGDDVVELRDLMASMVRKPIEDFRVFFVDFARSVDSVPDRMADDPGGDIDISATFVVQLEEGIDALLIHKLQQIAAVYQSE